MLPFSSYIDTENNIDSPCHRKNGVEIKGIKLFETNEKVVIENSGAKVGKAIAHVHDLNTFDKINKLFSLKIVINYILKINDFPQ